MNVEQELWQFRAGQEIVDQAMKAKEELEAIQIQLEDYWEGRYTCEHPPLTKSGVHNKKYTCQPCLKHHFKLNDQANSYGYKWSEVWSIMDSVVIEG